MGTQLYNKIQSLKKEKMKQNQKNDIIHHANPDEFHHGHLPSIYLFHGTKDKTVYWKNQTQEFYDLLLLYYVTLNTINKKNIYLKYYMNKTHTDLIIEDPIIQYYTSYNTSSSKDNNNDLIHDIINIVYNN